MNTYFPQSKTKTMFFCLLLSVLAFSFCCVRNNLDLLVWTALFSRSPQQLWRLCSSLALCALFIAHGIGAIKRCCRLPSTSSSSFAVVVDPRNSIDIMQKSLNVCASNCCLTQNEKYFGHHFFWPKINLFFFIYIIADSQYWIVTVTICQLIMIRMTEVE